MNFTAKKFASYGLAVILLVCTVIALLGIWDIIDLEHIVRKVLSSLLVIFGASVVSLFIFNVVINDKNKDF